MDNCQGRKSAKVHIKRLNPFYWPGWQIVTPPLCLLQKGLKILTLIIPTIFRAAEGNSGYKMTVYKESPGVYFDNQGHDNLSNTAWTIIVCVPVQTIDKETSNLERYIQYIDMTCCRMNVRNCTACSHFGEIMANKLQQIRNTRQLLSDITERDGGSRRNKRELFNCLPTTP
jgi:hypothetical protein